ncbi:MAG: glycine cleavage system protein GcvH [Marivibrio sp.]|uniref:glycine cleavage system protein GcvH n=1 Tax=Marivibrio sp. TaxID=2039719 RepID=UPI0032EE774E
MSQIYFSEDHEWIEVEGDVGVVGITNYAQEQLGDVVFVETPEVGAALDQGDEAGVVESVKAASEIYSPVSGEVSDVNEELADNPGLVNEEPEDGAWFFKIKLSDPGELDDLMDAAAYKKFCKDQD